MNTRLVALVALGAMLLGGLGAGLFVVVDLVRGDGRSEYCATLEEDREYFAADATGALLLSHLDELRDLASKAPNDLGDEWQTVTAAIGGLARALEDAGVGPDDFATGPPASLSEEDQQSIAAAASQLTQPDVVEAFSGIDQQAKDVCKLQLGL